MKNLLLSGLFFLTIPFYMPCFAQDKTGYTIVFEDQFDSSNFSQPDTSKWQRCRRENVQWNRFMSNSKEVVYIKDGKLKLRTIPTPSTEKDDAPMISGGVKTLGKFEFTYGIAECRLKVNPHTGDFPAFWMMPVNTEGGWPVCGEIDIMEHINNEGLLWHTIHSHWRENLGHKNDPNCVFTTGIDTNDFNTIALEWTEDYLAWYVNGERIGTYPRIPESQENGQWPFDKDFYIILNQSVGNGSWAAEPDYAHNYLMEVDWIKVYQKKESSGIEKQTAKPETLHWQTSEGCLTIQSDERQNVMVYNVKGELLNNMFLEGSETLYLPQGIYFINQHKVLVP